MDQPAMRLVDYAKTYLVVVPVDAIGGLIADGAIRIGGRIGRMAELVAAGAEVTVESRALARHAIVPEPHALAIHHEDAELVICEKPARMHVHPLGPHRTGTLLNALLWHAGARPDDPWGRWRPRPLHRLDRAASGLVAFAKTAATHDALRRSLADNRIERRYRALVHGRVRDDAGTIDAPLGRDPALDYRRAIVPIAEGGQRAVTHWTVIARDAERTALALVLETGRTHQLRAHLASIGHPIVGDTLYALDATPDRVVAAPAIALHAVALRLHHDGHDVTCTSPIPSDFEFSGSGAVAPA